MENADKIIRVCGIEKESIVDGPGFRYVLSCRAVLTDAPAVTILSRMILKAGQK